MINISKKRRKLTAAKFLVLGYVVVISVNFKDEYFA